MDNSAQPDGLLQQHTLPKPTDVPSQSVTPTSSQPLPKHFLAAFFLSFFLGVFGADRFYLGNYGYGLLKFLTFGWFGIGAIIDTALIMNGSIRDAHGRPLVGYEYKGTAKRVIAWVTGVSLVIALLMIAGVGILFVMLGGVNGLANLTGGGLGGDGSGSSTQLTTLLLTLL